MRVDQPIDVTTALNVLGFTIDSYFDLLMMFETTTLMKHMEQVKQAIE